MTPTHTPTPTTEAVADDATEPMQSDQIEGSRSQADQAASVDSARIRGTFWFTRYAAGRTGKVHLSERGDLALCGRSVRGMSKLVTATDPTPTWESLKHTDDACRECIKWDYHLYRPSRPTLRRRAR
jgi:hypothetical protein